MEALCATPAPVSAWHRIGEDCYKERTHEAIGALVDGGDVDHLRVETLLNLSDEQLYIPHSVEGAVISVHEGEQLFAVEVVAIRHLGPVVIEGHDGGDQEREILPDTIVISETELEQREGQGRVG